MISTRDAVVVNNWIYIFLPTGAIECCNGAQHSYPLRKAPTYLYHITSRPYARGTSIYSICAKVQPPEQPCIAVFTCLTQISRHRNVHSYIETLEQGNCYSPYATHSDQSGFGWNGRVFASNQSRGLQSTSAVCSLHYDIIQRGFRASIPCTGTPFV